MNAARLTSLLQEGVTAAEEHLPALETAYRAALKTAGIQASRRFERFTVDHLTADASNPGWTPPENDQLLNQTELAADASRRAKAAHRAALKAVLEPVLADIGITYDLRNPFVARLADKLGARAADLGDAVRGDIAKTILASYQDGLSVAATAKAIRAAVADISGVRAAMLARTDLIGLANGASLAAAQLVSGDGQVGFKQWLATEDERTRESHADADGQVVPIDQPFEVGGEQLMYPGDPDGSDAEVINCRCTLVYLDASDVAGTAGDLAAAGVTPTDAVASRGQMGESPLVPDNSRAMLANFSGEERRFQREFAHRGAISRLDLRAAAGFEDPLTADVTVTVSDDTPAEAAEMTAAPVKWRAILCVEGEPSQDGPSLIRMLKPGGGTWRDLPLPLGVMFETPHSDDAHAEVCGRIDSIYRDAADQRIIWGEGEFNTDEIGCRAAEMVGNLSLRGVSIDPYVALLEVTEPPVPNPGVAEEMDTQEVQPTLLTFAEYVIGGATICPFQALASATISIVPDAEGEMVQPRVVTASCFVLTVEEPAALWASAVVEELDPRVAASLAKLEQVARPDRFREYQLGMEIGLYTLNDCLTSEGRPPVEGGDERALPIPAKTLAQITDRLAEMARTHEALVAALERAAVHEESTQTLVASIDALTTKVAAGERVDEAMIETLRALSVRKPLDVIRDANGRAVAYEPRED